MLRDIRLIRLALKLFEKVGEFRGESTGLFGDLGSDGENHKRYDAEQDHVDQGQRRPSRAPRQYPVQNRKQRIEQVGQ